MTEQTQPVNGTVAEEAAWLIEAMASMARAGAVPRKDPSSYDGAPPRMPGSPRAPSAPSAPGASDHCDDPSEGACSACGGHSGGTPVACQLCPLCQGIAFLRSVRPETVDRLADLASAVATTLRDVATQSRSSGPPTNGPGSGGPSGGGRAKVQDIHVDDEDQG